MRCRSSLSGCLAGPVNGNERAFRRITRWSRPSHAPHGRLIAKGRHLLSGTMGVILVTLNSAQDRSWVTAAAASRHLSGGSVR